MTDVQPSSTNVLSAGIGTLLFVDDEPSILSALRRLFRAKGFQVRVAESGQAGLDLLESEPVDLVISDMRMPEMDGVAFLEQVRQRWPDSMRLLLTGYADVTSVMGAINRGEIYRYVAKPWDDNDIVLIVRGALQQRAMVLEQRRLQALVQQQNEELKELNAGLERKVQERTDELQKANAALSDANELLKANFITSIKVFTSLIELRNSHIAGHSRRVADMCRKLATRLGLDGKQTQEVFVAGLLHEIGKVGFDDDMLSTSVVMLTTKQLDMFRRHPACAAQLLLPLSDLRGAAEIISNQLERFDGGGHPYQLCGDQISMGARILIVACDYDSLQIGVLAQRKLDPAQAKAVIIQGRGRRYDPLVVDALVALLCDATRRNGGTGQLAELMLSTRDLQPGMVLAHDLVTPSGLLMLTAGYVLDEMVIQKIVDFEKSMGLRLMAEVKAS
ncbi:HD domain-containing phosphohydrolase [Candidatus Symbiobacter mobilis]|uniref:Response regulator n=1 Tax=Candidatus Symbiobacter mobilis CR TaxID=946483 RepID=U5N5C9_9BURK|nr:HD domain-containing phosphohydrolase [Candidatus Symbiobacter mobilis]AGX86557.1 response regulator [Candidatus Symbiobacter mobilis CR]